MMKFLIYTILILAMFLYFLVPNVLCAPSNDMKILKINGSQFAADKGSNNGVTIGSIYLIYQNNTMIGKAKVIAVREKICALEILEIKRNINIGDNLIYDNVTADESKFYIKDLDVQIPSKKDIRTKFWYTYWGFGIASMTYPSDIRTKLNYMEPYFNPSNVKICLDLLGLYFYLDNQLLFPTTDLIVMF